MAAALIAIQTWMASRTDRGDRGASLVEYALLIVLIAVVCAVAVGFLGESTNGGLSSAGDFQTAGN